MAKSFPSGLQSHLDSGSTTMCYCWRITRKDAVVQGFTEHDLDLTFDGTTFEAATGFTASMIATELGLNVDNQNVAGALSSDSLPAVDLAAGQYDDALVELFWVNFANVDERILQMKGSIGEVQRGDFSFNAEVRSLTHYIQQSTGRIYTSSCDAVLGDARCGITPSTSTGTVDSVSDNRKMVVSGLSNNTNDFYKLGTLMFDGNTSIFPVKMHTVSDGVTEVHLWTAPTITIYPADTFTITAGCDKLAATCKSKFSNLVNFRGFNTIPGEDFVTNYVTKEEDNDGGSMYDA